MSPKNDGNGTGPLLTRRATCIGLGAALMATAGRPASAADWPARPVKVIVPYSAGGNTDTMARLASQYLSEKTGESFIVENRPGASGEIGATAVARAEPDGYTLLFGASTQIVNLPMLRKVNYNPVKDLIPISILGVGPYLLGVKESLPVKTLHEFIAYVKANPGKLNYANPGVGGNVHLNSALFLARAGLDMVAIPYKSGAPSAAALLAGEVDMYFGNASELVAYAGGDRIKILAVSTLQRLPQLPNVPTVAEDYPGFDSSSWNGFFAPAGTPQAVIDVVARNTEAAARDPGIVDKLGKLAIIPFGSSPQEFRKAIDHSRVANREAMKAAGLTVIE
jgi:tripartite-type tricarboxylate transporter receptor subunit TctC